jgi:hypothetical protein
MTEHSTEMNGRDFSLKLRKGPPPGYPSVSIPDDYREFPGGENFDARREAFLDFCLRNPAPQNFKAPFFELARLARISQGKPGVLNPGVFEAALDYIDSRRDCSDFILHSLLRLLIQFPGTPLLEPALLERCRRTVLNFKYWPDEPGVDSLCTWTENHQVLYASAAYLAGQLFPEEVFTNSGHTGRQKMALSRPRLLKWLELRFRTGFSEWLSHVYYDEDLAALLSLVDFCADEGLQRQAWNVTTLILFDMALHNYRGAFACTHGRSYEQSKKRAAEEATSDTQKLLFGAGQYARLDNMSAVCFALSPRYRMPDLLYQIANDRERAELTNRQRMGIRLAEVERWGLRCDNFEDGMVFLSLEAYTHPRTVDLVLAMFDAFRWWENSYFEPFQKQRKLINPLRRLGLMPLVARLFERDVTRNTREEVNLYTYRTPDYALSCAQDYRKGYGGDQQHIWQATLAPNAVVFTTHPARREGHSPNYWVGSGTLPRAAQVKNVLIAIYKINTAPGLYHTDRLLFTHAWFPRAEFDQVLEQEGWIFARQGEGYLALRPPGGYRWAGAGAGEPDEVIGEGKDTLWICELGRRAVDGEFEAFVKKICSASLVLNRLSVRYESPSQGRLEFAWEGPLRQNGQPVALADYPRYDNPYCQAVFDPPEIRIHHGEEEIVLAL